MIIKFDKFTKIHFKPWKTVLLGFRKISINPHHNTKPNVFLFLLVLIVALKTRGASVIQKLPPNQSEPSPEDFLLPQNFSTESLLLRGVFGTGMNFPTRARGQLMTPMATHISHCFQFSFVVEANLPRNSTMITWRTRVMTIIPMKRRFLITPLKMFFSSGFRALNSLKAWQRTKALKIIVFLTLVACAGTSCWRPSMLMPRKLRTNSTLTW